MSVAFRRESDEEHLEPERDLRETSDQEHCARVCGTVTDALPGSGLMSPVLP